MYLILVAAILVVVTWINSLICLFGMPVRQKVTVWKNGKVDHFEHFWSWNPGLIKFFRIVKTVEVRDETANDGS